MISKELKNFLKNNFPSGGNFLIAFSGGKDSLALAHSFSKLIRHPELVSGSPQNKHYSATLVHIDHKVRPESTKEVTKIKELARDIDLPIICESFDNKKLAKQTKQSIETVGHIERKKILLKILNSDFPGPDQGSRNPSAILTAHHLNDDLETVLLNKKRGTGPWGLIGLQNHPPFYKPLLNVPVDAIQTYIEDHKLKPIEDPTNKEPIYERNRIRINIVPKLLKENPNLLEDFRKEKQQAMSLYNKLEKSSNALYKKWKKFAHVKTQDLASQPKSIQQTLLQRIYRDLYGSNIGLSSKMIEKVVQIISKNQSGKKAEFGSIFNAEINFSKLEFYPKKQTIPKPIKLKIGTSSSDIGSEGQKFGNYTINSSLAKAVPRHPELDSGSHTIRLDYDKLKSNDLTVRTWQPGDKFQPLGMKGTKKLQDFFTDKKIPINERSQLPIIASEKDIVLVGKYISNKYKITTNTKQVFKVELSKHFP